MTEINVSTAQEWLNLLALGSQFPDFNASFIPPKLTDPNYVPPFNGQGVVPVSVTLAGIALVVVAIRVYARTVEKSSRWGLDDWLIIPGLLITLATTILIIIHYYPYGLGHHSYDLSWHQILALYKLAFIHHIMYLWGTTIIRFSLLAFYLRLLPDFRSKTAMFIKVLGVFVLIIPIVGQLALVFAHSPPRAAWDANARLSKNYKSLNVWAIVTSLSAYYVAVDFIIWLLPLTIVWSLRMSLRRRVGLSFLFGVGGLACVALLIRTTLLYRLYNSFDTTWDAGSVALCNQVECYAAIVAASLPAVNGWYRMNLLSYTRSIKSACKSNIGSIYKRFTTRNTYATELESCPPSEPEKGAIVEEATLGSDQDTLVRDTQRSKSRFKRFMQPSTQEVNLTTWGISKGVSEISVDLPIQQNRRWSELDKNGLV